MKTIKTVQMPKGESPMIIPADMKVGMGHHRSPGCGTWGDKRKRRQNTRSAACRRAMEG